MPVALSITDRAGDTGDLTTYTFADRAIGTADASRTVLVGIAYRGNTAPDITGVNVGGNAAASLVTQKSTSTLDTAAIYALAVPAGTTATIVVTLSAAPQRLQIIVASLTGDYDPTPLDTSAATSADSSNGGDLNHDLSVNVAAGGAVLGIGQGATVSTLTLTWTGLTNDTQQAVEALRTMAATLAPVSTESPRTVSLNYNTDGSSGVLGPAACVVSFAPATGGGLASPLIGPLGKPVSGLLSRFPGPRHPQPDGHIRRRSGLYVPARMAA
jgi:hypothetical protein